MLSNQVLTKINQVANEGILLAVQLSGNELRLRLDTNGMALGKEDKLEVITLTLSECRNPSETREVLSQAIGEALDYDCYPSGGAIGTTTASFHLNHHDDAIEVTCAQAIEVASAYTLEDLLYKCRQLSSLYLAAADRESKIGREHYSYTTGLQAEINNELDRCRRKLEFFLTVNPQKASAMQAKVIAYERVLTLMSHQKKSG